jgi:hypothetical protein
MSYGRAHLDNDGSAPLGVLELCIDEKEVDKSLGVRPSISFCSCTARDVGAKRAVGALDSRMTGGRAVFASTDSFRVVAAVLLS